MKLSVLERLIAQTLLPKEGSFINMRLVRKAKEALSFTEEEVKAGNFRQVDGQTMWDNGKIPDLDIDLGEVATSLIVAELKKLSETNKLTAENLTVYEKFVEGV